MNSSWRFGSFFMPGCRRPRIAISSPRTCYRCSSQQPWRQDWPDFSLATRSTSQGVDMREWIHYSKLAPEGFQALLKFDEYVRHSDLEPSLLELVRIRVSQINGCGYCIDIHTKDARAAGESEQRRYCLPAWQETPF